MHIYVKKTQTTRDQLLALSDELYGGLHVDKGITDFHYGFGEGKDTFDINFEILGTEEQIAFIKLIDQSLEIVKIEPAKDGKEYEEEAIQWWRNTQQSGASQEAATKPNSFDTRIQSWDTEILSVDKRVGCLGAFGALVILAGIFIFWVGSQNEGATAEVIAVVSIIAAAVLLLQTNKSHKKAIKKLTDEIQQACEDEGFGKREVVKTLYRHQNREVPDAARTEILRTVDRDTFLGLLRQAPVEYFESPPPKGDGRCSDNECPCPETPIPRGQGFLYIPPRVVEMRRDARTMKALRAKLERTRQHDEIMSQFRHAIVVPRQGLYHPILMCRQGAERRGIDLEVAAKDAAFWWQTGRVPLRPTPRTSARKPKPQVGAAAGYTVEQLGTPQEPDSAGIQSNARALEVSPYGSPEVSLAQPSAPMVAPAMTTDQKPRVKTNALAVASLVLGIIALLTSCAGVGVLPGVAAFIAGIIGGRQIRDSDGPQAGAVAASAGRILGGVSVLLGIASLLAYLLLILLTLASRNG